MILHLHACRKSIARNREEDNDNDDTDKFVDIDIPMISIGIDWLAILLEIIGN